MTTVFVHLPLYSLCSHYSAPRHQIVLVSHFIEKNPVGLQFLLAQFYHSCKKKKCSTETEPFCPPHPC